MPVSQSVTAWLGRLKEGDKAAAQQLWTRYIDRLVRVAFQKLRGTHRPIDNEEDVALSAFASFCRRFADGRFPDLTDRHGLWPLLAAITARKAIKAIARERRLKRGGGTVRGDSVLDAGESGAGWQQVLGREPSPAFACQVAEEFQRLLQALPDESLRSVALWKMEGYTNEEIAAKLGCVERTVDRKLRAIRCLWEAESA